MDFFIYGLSDMWPLGHLVLIETKKNLPEIAASLVDGKNTFADFSLHVMNMQLLTQKQMLDVYVFWRGVLKK